MNAPTLPNLPPIWREGRASLEAAALLRSPVWRGEDVPDGEGQPVLLIPGFLAGDGSLGLMTRWLRRTGHHTRKAGIRANVNCSGDSVEPLEERLELLAERHGQRVAIIGQSRGGQFARVLAVRRPDLVSGIVTLGTPSLERSALHPLVRAQVLAVGVLGTLGVPGMFRTSCWRGDCCTEFAEQLTGPFPGDVGYMGVYSKTDGIVSWRSCLDPAADAHVEVRASHVGMSANPEAFEAVAESLDRFRRADLAGSPPVAVAA